MISTFLITMILLWLNVFRVEKWISCGPSSPRRLLEDWILVWNSQRELSALHCAALQLRRGRHPVTSTSIIISIIQHQVKLNWAFKQSLNYSRVIYHHLHIHHDMRAPSAKLGDFNQNVSIYVCTVYSLRKLYLGKYNQQKRNVQERNVPLSHNFTRI